MMWVYLWRTIYPPKIIIWEPEYKITEGVNDGLGLMKMFPPKSQVQTLLLAPTFLIGCAAFDPAQRPTIRQSLATIKEYTHHKNSDRALEVLQEVWKYMDAQDERSWDWQQVAHDMGMDFLVT
jgi:Fungal specific transcription factor domain